MRMDEAQVQGVAAQVKDSLVLEVDGRFVQLDRYGYLVDPGDWSKAVTERMAELDGLELQDDHWLLIDFLHRFFKEFAMAPEMPILARNLCKDQKDCRWSRRYIKELFPGGAKVACRYAGLPEPAGRSCG